jgi:hypothetical protein
MRQGARVLAAVPVRTTFGREPYDHASDRLVRDLYSDIDGALQANESGVLSVSAQPFELRLQALRFAQQVAEMSTSLIVTILRRNLIDPDLLAGHDSFPCEALL